MGILHPPTQALIQTYHLWNSIPPCLFVFWTEFPLFTFLSLSFASFSYCGYSYVSITKSKLQLSHISLKYTYFFDQLQTVTAFRWIRLWILFERGEIKLRKKNSHIREFIVQHVAVAQLLHHVYSFVTHGLQPERLICPRHFPDKNTGMGCHFLLQGLNALILI